jgi:hemerythrin
MEVRFVWSDEYSVGVAIVDEQHKHFFDIANLLYDSAASGKTSPENALALAIEMSDYALYHLNTEEGYFKKFSYADAAIHTSAHGAFRAKMVDYLARVRGGEEDLNVLVREIADYSGNWLKSHILVMDKRFGGYFRDHGLL